MLGTGFSADNPVSTLQALGVLASIVAVHEAGHFIAARAQGIHVTKFSIGFGPPLFTYQGKQVEYSLRAFPLGGFVAFPDDDPSSTFEQDDPDLLKNRPIAQRALVVSAGVIANILFSLSVLFTQVNTIGKAETAYLAGVKVPEVQQSSAAARAGLQPGDLILRVGDFQVTSAPSQVTELVTEIQAHPSERLQLEVERKGRRLQLPITPDRGDNGVGKIGVSLSSNAFINHIHPKDVSEAWGMTWSEFKRLGATVVNGLKSIFTNFNGVAAQLSGPVAIVVQGADIARTDAAGLFQFCAIVNINLAAVNILPLPALDGGYLVLLALEAARGRKLPEGLEQTVMASGIVVLTMLGLGLVIKDTLNLL